MNVDKITNKSVHDVFSGTFRSLFVGCSQSGKSYFLTQKVLPVIQYQYDRVFVFTRPTSVPYYEKHTWDWNANREHRVWNAKSETAKELYKRWYGEPKYKRFICINDQPRTVPMALNQITSSQDANALSKLNDTDEKSFKYKLLIIFDDVLNEKLNNTDEMRDLFTNYRHYNISTIMLAQVSSVLTTTAMKNNINILVMAKMPLLNMRKTLINDYIKNIMVDVYEDEDEAKRKADLLYNKVCKEMDHGLLIIDLDKSNIYWQGGHLPKRDIPGWNDDNSRVIKEIKAQKKKGWW